MIGFKCIDVDVFLFLYVFAVFYIRKDLFMLYQDLFVVHQDFY